LAHNKDILQNPELFWGWDTPAGKLRARRRADMIITEIKKKNASKILEIGSGTGLFTKFFQESGLKMHGMDISLDLLEKAKSKYSIQSRPQFSVADAEYLPYKSNSFDAVVGVCVLHHLNLEGTLKEIKRVLRQDGIILFSEPNMMNPQLMIQKNIKPIKKIAILGETEDETAFFRWKLKRQLEKLGFNDVSIRPFDFLHPWTPKAFIPHIIKLGACLEKTPFLKEIAGSLFISAVK
ncbi:MAG: methyltransferase domain-containing protein, partial [Candidatus Omnitrophota bacterium]